LGADILMVTYIQKDHFEVTRLDDEWILLNAEAFTVTRLNELGGYCWNLLNEEQSVESLVKAIEKEFPTMEDICNEDIEGFLDELQKYGLITHAL
jgi:hypothetical protein